MRLGGEFVEEGAEMVAPFFPEVVEVDDVEEKEDNDNNGVVGGAVAVNIF